MALRANSLVFVFYAGHLGWVLMGGVMRYIQEFSKMSYAHLSTPSFLTFILWACHAMKNLTEIAQELICHLNLAYF